MRLLASAEAMIGYIYLGFLVGAAFHWASRSKRTQARQMREIRKNAGRAITRSQGRPQPGQSADDDSDGKD
jgi:hypothetical protein